MKNKLLPTLRLINNRKGTATAKKPSPVELRLTYNGKQRYFGTGVLVMKNEWDKANEIVKCRPDAASLNKILLDEKNKMQQEVMALYAKGEFDISAFGKRKACEKDGEGFLTFVETIIKKEEKTRENGTIRRWRSWLGTMKEWEGIKTFEDLTKRKVVEFDDFLHQRGYEQTTIAGYHKLLRRFIGEAVKADLISYNVYSKYGIHIPQGEPRQDKFLTQNELTALVKADMPTESLSRVRDVFVFQCLTGLAYKDLANFSPEYIEKDDDGTCLYTNRRMKTKVVFCFVLLPKAIEILGKYDMHLPVISNVDYNRYLKVIAQAAGIDKPISTHWGRHTAAMYWLNHGIPLEVVSRCLGHSSTRITQSTYARFETGAIKDAFGKMDKESWMVG